MARDGMTHFFMGLFNHVIKRWAMCRFYAIRLIIKELWIDIRQYIGYDFHMSRVRYGGGYHQSGCKALGYT